MGNHRTLGDIPFLQRHCQSQGQREGKCSQSKNPREVEIAKRHGGLWGLWDNVAGCPRTVYKGNPSILDDDISRTEGKPLHIIKRDQGFFRFAIQSLEFHLFIEELAGSSHTYYSSCMELCNISPVQFKPNAGKSAT
jgi:hypothetical protein